MPASQKPVTYAPIRSVSSMLQVKGSQKIPFWDTTLTTSDGNTFAPGYSLDVDLNNLNSWNITLLTGVGRLAGITLSVDVHTKRGTNALVNPGKDKGKPIVGGIKPASFSIEQLIFDYDSFTVLTAQLKILWTQYVGKAAPAPLYIYNPALNQIGIIGGTPVSLTSLKPHASGGRVITIEFLEWQPAGKKATVAKPKQIDGEIVDTALNQIDQQDIANRKAKITAQVAATHATGGTPAQNTMEDAFNGLATPSQTLSPSGQTNTKQ